MAEPGACFIWVGRNNGSTPSRQGPASPEDRRELWDSGPSVLPATRRAGADPCSQTSLGLWGVHTSSPGEKTYLTLRSRAQVNINRGSLRLGAKPVVSGAKSSRGAVCMFLPPTGWESVAVETPRVRTAAAGGVGRQPEEGGALFLSRPGPATDSGRLCSDSVTNAWCRLL